MKNISVCIISKNESKSIGMCLEALKNMPVEIVVVDTGSTDNTVSIAKNYTDKVFSFEWCDDFSEARNYAAKMASNNYIVALDCDEFIEKFSTVEVVNFLKSNPLGVGTITLENLVHSGTTVSKAFADVGRVYDRRFCHFVNRVHEQIEPIGKGTKIIGKLSATGIHVGYLLDKDAAKNKNERNIRLLLMEIEENDKDPYVFYQLAHSYSAIGMKEEAYVARKKALALNPSPKNPYVEDLVREYCDSCMEHGAFEDALVIENYYDDMCDSADYMFELGQVYFANGRIDDSLLAFEAATVAPNVHAEGANTFFPLHAMSVIYESLGNMEKAKACEDKAQEYLAKR